MAEPEKQTKLSRELRRQQTDAEKALWARLRNRQLGGVKFRRQQPLGPYIVDFVALEKRIIVEVDGSQHGEERRGKRDKERTAWLQRKGYQVLRFWNNEVLLNREAVLERIMEAMHPHPNPLPSRERG
ncbi:MAG: endonuclease domain-containing protein [Dehalococcoidia bacterium]